MRYTSESAQVVDSNHQLFISKWSPREALQVLQVQTFGINISRMACARINRRPDSEFTLWALYILFWLLWIFISWRLVITKILIKWLYLTKYLENEKLYRHMTYIFEIPILRRINSILVFKNSIIRFYVMGQFVYSTYVSVVYRYLPQTNSVTNSI